MSRKQKIALTAATAAILVAAGELSGGGIVVASGEELTEDKADAIGLDEAAVADLLERGKLLRVDVRQAENVDAAALADATTRAEAAEARVAELEAQVADLTAAAPTASKDPAKA